MKKVLVILGHPRSPSLCASLAEAYAQGTLAAGMEVATLDLGALTFDPDVHPVSPRDQVLEPDLERAIGLIEWADHLAFIYPAWWGVGPARLKGFLDRVLLPEFAFRMRSDGRFEGLLSGKSAHLITTLDMPPWVYRWLYRAPGHTAMRRSTLGFCGIRTTSVLALGPVKDSTPVERADWLEQSRKLGFSLSKGPLTHRDRIIGRVWAWLKAMRLRFYPMAWLAYAVGAFGAARYYQTGLDWPSFWLGFVFLFFAELATVHINDVFDFPSDRQNKHFGPFNGGSRVLVNKELTFRQIGIGISIALMLTMASAGLLLDRAENTLSVLLVLATALVLGLGYTAPPLKLSWRALGELTVAAMHSVVLILCGFLLQGGEWNAAWPWLIGLPLLVAVLPSITLAGIPDMEADIAAGKRTLTARLGPRKAALFAIACTVAASLLVLAFKDLPAIRGSLDGLLPWTAPHAALLVFMLYRYLQQPVIGRMDLLIITALAYTVWFGLVPLLQLIG